MRRIIKLKTSNILTNNYCYPANRVSILAELDVEQGNFCAYTEEYYSPGYARDVEHFNPTLKKTPKDSYKNWYSASSRFNRKKGSKKRWLECQPILYPTNRDLEKRLIYKDGDYILANLSDRPAKNLRTFLFLNEMGLPEARIAYIEMIKCLLTLHGDDKAKLKIFLQKNPAEIRYRTAIKAELGIIL